MIWSAKEMKVQVARGNLDTYLASVDILGALVAISGALMINTATGVDLYQVQSKDLVPPSPPSLPLRFVTSFWISDIKCCTVRRTSIWIIVDCTKQDQNLKLMRHIPFIRRS